MDEFYNFQKHRKSGLPKLLQGEILKFPATQQTKTQNPEAGSSTKQETLENLEKSEVSTQKGNIPDTEILDNQGKYQEETIINKGEYIPKSSPKKSTTEEVMKQLSTTIGNPIEVVTPLQFTRGNPNTKAMFIRYFTPIPIEEIPPTEFLFNKKRKFVVKKEMHIREGEMVKKNRVLLDGQNLEEENFSTEVGGSLGAFEMTNLFSVDNLKERLRQRNQTISQLRDQIRNTKNNIKNEVSKGLE
jgi:hypothetical protein